MKKTFEIVLTVLCALTLVLITVCPQFNLMASQYPNLNEPPEVGQWYRITDDAMKSSDGSGYRAFFKKGREEKVLIYFAGGGVSVNAEMAKNETYNKNVAEVDWLANIMMNLGGIASDGERNPFADWSVIAFPYATADFHAGTGEFKYTDKNGEEQTLYHYGYINYTAAMKTVLEKAGIENAEAVVVTGYSAGGFGAALLADDVFANYFPNAASKTVLADASLLLRNDWRSVAENVWKTPKEISDRLVTNDITLDSLKALKYKYGDNVNVLFDVSTRDGDLAKVQNYFDNGKNEVDESVADEFQRLLIETMPKYKEAGVYLFIWDGLPWYDDPRNLTMHTIIATPYVYQKLGGDKISVAEWLMDAVNGKPRHCGLDLLRF